MFSPQTPFHQSLDGGLILKSVADMHDVERLAEFNGLIHGPQVAAMTLELILNHPHTRPDHWLFIEDESTGQVVSSLCLIPWTWRYDGVEIKSGEMGIVGTLEAYRRRGLVRRLVARFEVLLREGGFHLSHIQGIPYFYRQFGYEYALPLEGGWHLNLYQIADLGEAETVCFCAAENGDIPTLMQLYDRAVQSLGIHAVRSADEWRYLLGPSTRTETNAETWLVETPPGKAAGYVRVPAQGFGEGVICNEASSLDASAALAVLRLLKKLALERGKPFIRLNLPLDHTLTRLAQALGGHDGGRYAWQIHLVDVARLLRHIGPVLERRLAASPFAGLTRTVTLDLYREAFALRFESGRLVDLVKTASGGDIRLPPNALAPLLLGYRSREELQHMYPDFSAWGENQLLVDVMFPKMSSFIYTIY